MIHRETRIMENIFGLHLHFGTSLTIQSRERLRAFTHAYKSDDGVCAMEKSRDFGMIVLIVSGFTVLTQS